MCLKNMNLSLYIDCNRSKEEEETVTSQISKLLPVNDLKIFCQWIENILSINWKYFVSYLKIFCQRSENISSAIWNTELQKRKKIATTNFFTQKISTKKWPKNYLKLPKIAPKWPKIAQIGTKMTQNCRNGPKMTQNGPKISTSWQK